MLILGVDAHKRVHAAVAVDEAGREVGAWRGMNSPAGWQELLAWTRTLDSADPARLWGVEGAGQYGRGLAQTLVAAGEVVMDVNPRWTAAMRSRQRRRGKSDRLDAAAVAQVVRQEGAALPSVALEDETTVLGVLVSERDAALAEATRLRNQLHQALAQLDPTYEHWVGDLTEVAVVERLTVYVAPSPSAVDQARAGTVCRLAARLLLALEQAEALKAEIERRGMRFAALRRLTGVGPLTAGMLGAALGPGQRFATDAQLAMHSGVAPLEASSGERVRHRLNRGGNRALNAIFERIVLTQARCYPPAQAYLARRRAEGKTDREAKRALKRYIARAVWRLWQEELAQMEHAMPARAA